MGVLVSLVAAGVLAATPGQAAPVQDRGHVPAPQDADLGTVEVTGQRTEDSATAFVETVGAAPPDRPLARWDRAICVGVANMRGAYAQFMIDRVSAVALDLGLAIGEPGCRPSILIIATADADATAAALVRDHPFGFRPALNQTDLGRSALERFQTSDAPVRWWHVSLPVSVDTGDLAVRLEGEDAPTIRVRDPSRMRSNVRDDLARVVIVLDTSRIGVVSWAALSDHVAFAAPAQIDPAADVSAWPSVLNLFTASPPPEGLTDWDLGYLHALYGALRSRARPAQQAREIVRGLVEARTGAETPEPAGGEAPSPQP